MLELWERRRKVEGSTCQVLFLWIAKDQQESGIAHVLVGLFSLLGTLLGRLDLGAELVDFLQNDDNDVGQPWISPRLQHVRGILAYLLDSVLYVDKGEVQRRTREDLRYELRSCGMHGL